MLRAFRSVFPSIDPTAYVDISAQIIGDVHLGAESSVWMNVVIRGDVNYIRVGARSNVQDNSVVHVTPELPCIIGEGVTIGHRCVVHACTIGNNVRIGIGAVVLTGAVIEDNAQVGAGALVPPGKVVPSGTLVMGVPAKPVRQMNEEELDDIRRNAREYLELWQTDYRA